MNRDIHVLATKTPDIMHVNDWSNYISAGKNTLLMIQAADQPSNLNEKRTPISQIPSTNAKRRFR